MTTSTKLCMTGGRHSHVYIEELDTKIQETQVMDMKTGTHANITNLAEEDGVGGWYENRERRPHRGRRQGRWHEYRTWTIRWRTDVIRWS